MKPRMWLASTLMLLMVQAGGAQDEAKKDLQRMNGAWAARLVEQAGKLASTDDQARFKVKLIVSGNTYKAFFDDKQIASGVMALDPNKRPKTIDVFPMDGPDKGKVQPGIYTFVGDDMVVVFTDPGKQRPAQFKTRPGTDEIYLSYQRIKK